MSTAAVLVPLVLAGLLIYTAVRKLGHRVDVVRTYQRVGVAERHLNLLAFILLAAAAGLLAGLIWPAIGIVAAGGLVIYFTLAVAAHIHFKDLSSLPTPIAMWLMSAGTLVLFVLS